MNQHGGRGDDNGPQWANGQAYAYPPPPQQPIAHHGYPQAPQPYGYPAPHMMAPHPLVVVQQSNTTITQKAPFNHGTHFVITLLTCGAWLPVWILLAIVH